MATSGPLYRGQEVMVKGPWADRPEYSIIHPMTNRHATVIQLYTGKPATMLYCSSRWIRPA